MHLNLKIMEEIILQCALRDEDKMIVSVGTHISMQVIEDEKSTTICIDKKQAAKLIHYLSIYIFNEL
jgi:hypothetical protein